MIIIREKFKLILKEKLVNNKYLIHKMEKTKPLISICIPAYQNSSFLTRLLNSIKIQTYTAFEVIITDDSPDDSVEEVIKSFLCFFKIKYYKNYPALGTPANWNEAIKQSTGDWIKIMHDDDWFASKNSLQEFVSATFTHPQKKIIFSAYTNIFFGNNQKQNVIASKLELLILKLFPLVLFKKVIIGNPSCTFIHSSIHQEYDKNIKWAVDFDYYLRILANNNFHFIKISLINVGFHENQVTQFVTKNPYIMIPESHYMLQKFGSEILKNIFVYDYYWRLYRNYNISSVEQLNKYPYSSELPQVITKIINTQNKINKQILKKGFYSKFLMTLSYLNII